MSEDTVSLPATLVDRLDELVDTGVFDSRSEALRYGAGLVIREERDELRPETPTDEIPAGRSRGITRSAQE